MKSLSKMVDLRSDTVTRPSEQMRRSVLNCKVGDDVSEEDKSTNILQQKVAKLFNKESSLFVNSGTMSNLLSLMVHCQNKYQSCIVGDKSHILNYEGGGVSSIGNIQTMVLKMDNKGEFDLDELERIIPPPTEHISQPTVISLENTVCMQGGIVLSLDYIKRVREIADRYKLKMHLDGARLFNALVDLDVEINEISQYFDSISICLSKGLGCPMGSMLISDNKFIEQARFRRKMIGGGMRQCGVMAVQAIDVLDNWKQIFINDKNNALYLQNRINSLEKVRIDHLVQSNILFMTVQQQSFDYIGLSVHLKQEFNILANPGFKNEHIRLVVHKDIIKQDIEYFVAVIDHIINHTELQINNLELDLVFRDRNCQIELNDIQDPKNNEHQIIDMRSDTITKPNWQMRKLISQAQVGDDVYKDDEITNQLEQQAAQLFGFEAGLFVSSGCMGNLVCSMIHCNNKGDSMIIGQHSHINLWERGNISAIGNIYPKLVDNNSKGELDLSQIDRIIQENIDHDFHYVTIKSIALESSHNYSGGKPLSLQYLGQINQIKQKYGFKLHLDGARVLNACMSLKVDPKEYCQYFDSVTICLSKGLGCPVGSVIMGSKEFIKKAISYRKLLGGNNRQIGMLCAPALEQLANYERIIGTDNQNAKYLAQQLKQIDQVTVDLDQVQTNVVLFNIQGNNDDLVKYLANSNVFILHEYGTFRVKTNLHINQVKIDRLVELIRQYFQ